MFGHLPTVISFLTEKDVPQLIDPVHLSVGIASVQHALQLLIEL